MTFGPQSSAVEQQTATELMARRRRIICEGLLRDLLDPNFEVEDADRDKDSARYFMLWLANRALTEVTPAEIMLANAPAGACPPSETGAGGADGVPEPAEMPAGGPVCPVVIARSHTPNRGMSGPLTLARGWLRLLANSRPLTDLHGLRLQLTGVLLTGKGSSRRVVRYPVLPRQSARHHLKSRIANLVTPERWWRLSRRSETAQLTDSSWLSAPPVEGEGPMVPAQRRGDDRRQDVEPPGWPGVAHSVLFRRMATIPG